MQGYHSLKNISFSPYSTSTRAWKKSGVSSDGTPHNLSVQLNMRTRTNLFSAEQKQIKNITDQWPPRQQPANLNSRLWNVLAILQLHWPLCNCVNLGSKYAAHFVFLTGKGHFRIVSSTFVCPGPSSPAVSTLAPSSCILALCFFSRCCRVFCNGYICTENTEAFSQVRCWQSWRWQFAWFLNPAQFSLSSSSAPFQKQHNFEQLKATWSLSLVLIPEVSFRGCNIDDTSSPLVCFGLYHLWFSYCSTVYL